MKQEILTERINLFEPSDYIFFHLELCGDFTAYRLAEAMRAAFSANEATMSRIVLTASGNAYYERIDESCCNVEIVENADVWEVARQNEKRPFALEKGELVRCFVIPGGNSFSLLVMSHHLAGDGKSICCFVEDVMRALSGKKLEFKPLTLLTKENIPCGKISLTAKLYAKYCQRKWNKMKAPAFRWKDYYHLHESYWSGTSSLFMQKTLSQDETNCVIASAKKIGVSVNSYIVAAFLCANKNIRVAGIPVSVREKDNCSMTNLTSGIRTKYSYKENLSFPDNARKLHDVVVDELSRNKWFVLQFMSMLPPTLVDSVLLCTHGLFDEPFVKQTAEVMGYAGAKKRELGVTNLTVIDIPAVYENVKIKSLVFMPPNVTYSDNIIGVSTFNGAMTLTYHGTEQGSKEQLNFFNRGVDILLKECTAIKNETVKPLSRH